MRELFISGKLLVNKRCINLITELESYSYDEDNNEKNEQENPIKFNDHAIDATRYVVMSKVDYFRPTEQEVYRRFQAQRNNKNNFAR